jgi:small subunit ribosomal protein S3
VEKKLANAGISQVRIERKADQIDLEIHTARPGVVVGRGGQGIEELRSKLLEALGGSNRQIRINVIEVARVDADAGLIAEYIAQQLERRVSFRRVVRQAIQRAQRAEVQGIKVQVSGRLNGQKLLGPSGRGKVEYHYIPSGQTSTTLTAPAKTIYGILGVKFGSSKARLFQVRKKCLLLIMLNPGVANSAAASNLKTAQMSNS